MECPHCGSSNRDDASYCDACGQSLRPGAPKLVSGSDGLVGMMTADWTIRFFLAGVAGILGAIASASVGAFGFVVVFALISVVGWAGFVYMLRNAPS